MTHPHEDKSDRNSESASAESFSETSSNLGPLPWPTIQYASYPWDAEPEPGASRRRRLAARGPYSAAIPPRIANLIPQVSPRTAALAESATIEMARFDGGIEANVGNFATLLLRTESASSSQIEELTAGARRIALAGFGDESSGNAKLINANTRAMVAAIELSGDLSVKNIAEMHRELLKDSNPAIAGHYRDSQVWIRGASPHTAEFVPPHHDEVPAAMDDLVQFMRRDDVPALIQTAVAHAHFETIHPFADGNGRTGRALVTSMLRNKNVATNSTIPVSSGLLVDTSAYFEALTAYRAGDLEPIVEQFADAAERAIDNTRELVYELDEISYRWGALTGKLSAAEMKFFNYIITEPAMTADAVSNATEVSTATAYRIILKFAELGILKNEGTVHGRRVWTAPDVLDALDAFAIRAGRRAKY